MCRLDKGEGKFSVASDGEEMPGEGPERQAWHPGGCGTGRGEPLTACGQKRKRIYARDLETSRSPQRRQLRAHLLRQRASGPSSTPKEW